MSNLYWLSEAQMERLRPYFPKARGRARVDDRRVLSGIIFINRNGLRWCDAPAEYGPPKTLYNRWKRWSDMGVFARILMGLGAISLSFLATKERIDAISKIDWTAGATTRGEAKAQMKDVGATVFQYTTILHESSLLSLAKAIEDTSIDLRKSDHKFRFHVWKSHHDVVFLKELRTITALANVIKHNQSFVERNTSESAKFLVDECEVENEVLVQSLVLACDPIVNIVTYIPQVFIAMLELVEKSHGFRIPVLDKEFPDAANYAYDMLLPDILGIEKPRFTAASQNTRP